jgi:hypothetical protein
MRLFTATCAGAILGAAALTTSAIPASAEIACSGNVCWHVKERHVYPPDAKVIIHEDDWRWRPEEKYEWREHEGPGYWRDGAWVTIGPNR